MSTSASIRTFLTARLAAVANVPLIAEEGVKFTRAPGVPFVRFKLMPAETDHASIGANYVLELKGLAQLDVFFPSLRGMVDVETMAQAIVSAFAPGTYLDGSEQVIIDAAWVDASREEPSWLHLPVLVRWRAFRLAS